MFDSFVTTKIRPVRKVFIIDENDIKTFSDIFNHLMIEIDGVINLIFPTNNKLFSQNTKEFVNRYDPDVILNYSILNDLDLSEHFNTITYNSKSSNYNLNKFGSPIFTFTGTPYLASKDPTLIPKKVFSHSKLEPTPESLFLALNYGVLNKKNLVQLKRMPSIFQEVIVSCVDELPDIYKVLFDNDIKYHNLTNSIGSAYSSSSSIFDINYNPKNFFHEKGKKYAFISRKENLDFILYFWNIRCIYNSSQLAWIPIDVSEKNRKTITKDVTIVISNEEDRKHISNIYPDNEHIVADKYYFHGGTERWINFEHDQYITTNSQEKLLTHPNEKTFSDIGFGGGYVFEIRGPSEFLYTKKYFLGHHFSDKLIDQSAFPEYFTRLSKLGLSVYFSHFTPYQTSGVTQSFKLPLFKELLKHHFAHFDLIIEETPKTYILEQLINIIGGIDNAYLLCNEKTFNLLISLTPHTRTKQLIKKALPELEKISSDDDLIAYLGTLKERGEISFTPTVVTMETIISKLQLNKNEFEKFSPNLQTLCDKKIFLRGKNFKCNHCSAILWFSLESFQRDNYCVECGNSVKIPVFIEGKIQSDHYKLNQLVSRAIDQGQLSTALLINHIHKQKYSHFNYESNYEIFKNGELISDIDLFIKIGKKLGLCECKSNSSFTKRQIDELINTAQVIGSDFIILSCLLTYSDEKIIEIKEYITKKNLSIPVFIITKDELFNDHPQRLYSYFEVNYRTGKFYEGPILLGAED
ncbi:hypothetical protein [Pectobacterium parvum]|uniref:hypothetical protein n=1 Tax=Pectobacterium parvum TaxID=2778550 RepID=UPI000DC641B4|nr:hypothetical protein [Pectobacterium parvum]